MPTGFKSIQGVFVPLDEELEFDFKHNSVDSPVQVIELQNQSSPDSVALLEYFSSLGQLVLVRT